MEFHRTCRLSFSLEARIPVEAQLSREIAFLEAFEYIRSNPFMMKPERITRTDKTGKSFEIGIGCAEDFPSVLEMYRVFSPKPASQGLPPEDPETCHTWVKNLFNIGKNFLAWRGDTIIGHAASVPDPNGKSGEFVIFVDQNHRNAGIGTELTRLALEKSKDLGLDSVWLTVNITNFIALKLYRKLGFEYGDMDKYERVMTIQLRLPRK
jgi:RimJ/RimL family protein N-acetyltransferase